MDSNNLPEQVYALGFVRSYAHHLGLDPQETVNQFKQDIFESGSSDKKLPIPQHFETATLPTKRILWISTLAVLISLGLARYFWNANHTDSSLEQELSNLLRPSS
jgi:cytoskeleton protein RodZ